jgi:hypothetical protein
LIYRDVFIKNIFLESLFELNPSLQFEKAIAHFEKSDLNREEGG